MLCNIQSRQKCQFSLYGRTEKDIFFGNPLLNFFKWRWVGEVLNWSIVGSNVTTTRLSYGRPETLRVRPN
jgi:hypothetical protein